METPALAATSWMVTLGRARPVSLMIKPLTMGNITSAGVGQASTYWGAEDFTIFLQPFFPSMTIGALSEPILPHRGHGGEYESRQNLIRSRNPLPYDGDAEPCLADGFIIVGNPPTTGSGHFGFAPLSVTYHHVSVTVNGLAAMTTVDEGIP